MATAKATTTSPLAAVQGEEEERKLAEVRQLQQQLKDALDYRKGFYLDPSMLAIAQGFAAPTRTGSFFESLGTVAGNLGRVQEEERKRAQEIAQMRLELAMGELGLQQQQRQRKEVEQYLGGPPPGASGTPGAVSAPSAAVAPTDASAAQMPGAQPSGVQAPVSKVPSIDEIERVRTRNPLLADIMTRQREAAEKAVKVTDKGVFTITPGEGQGFRYAPTPGGATVERFQPGVGTLNFSPSDAAKFDEVTDVLSSNPNDSRAQQELARLISKVRGAATKRPGPQTPSEAALGAEVDKARALDQVKGENERFTAAMTRASGAPVRIAQYDSMIDMASRPDTKKFLGVFEGPKLRDALLKLGEGAGLPEIRDIFINLGLDKNVKADQLAFQQRMALVNLEIRKMTRTPGEGAISDFEGRMIAASGLDRTDTPEGMLKKLQFLRAKDEFDLSVARALRSSKMPYDEFVLENPTYADLVQKYYKTLSNIVGIDTVNKASQAGTGAPAPAAGGSPQGESLSARRLREWQERQRGQSKP